MTVDSSGNDFSDNVKPLRVLVKSMVLFVVLNILLSSFSSVDYFVFERLMPKQDQFPIYVIYPDPRARHGFGIRNVFDLNVLFKSHIISRDEKSKNEYRIIFIGDSTVRNGSAYLSVDGYTCGGRILRSYNLGYYGFSATKDLLILQDAMRYRPDMIIWSVTSDTFQGEPKTFALANITKLDGLALSYQLPVFVDQSYNYGETMLYWDSQLRLQMLLLANYNILYPAIHNEQKIISAANEDLKISSPSKNSTSGSHNDLFTAISVGLNIANGAPVVVINEPRPSLVIKENEYIRYRGSFSNLSVNQHWIYLDLSNLIPDQEFYDKVHRNKNGEALFEKAIVPAVLQVACGKNK